MPEQENKLLAGETDPLSELFAFSRDVLGYKLLTSLHLNWFQALLENQFLLLLAPRGHLKSSVVTTSYPLWRLARNRDLRILIVCETLPMARRMLDVIKAHLVSNEKFRSRYGALDTMAGRWAEDSILLPRQLVAKEPSIGVGAVLSNLVSTHADIVILDDVATDGNSATPAQRDKLFAWYSSVIIPALEPSGQLIICGTRWSHQDLYAQVLEDPSFAKIVLAAESTDAAGRRRAIFPERFSLAKLDQLKKTMGLQSYALQYLNDPATFIDVDFKPSWIESGRYDIRPENLTVYAGIDLAIARKESSSFFAYIVIGKDRQGNVYVLDGYRDRIPLYEQIQSVKRLKRCHSPAIIIVEDNAFQAAFVEALRMDEECRYLPLKTKTATGDKVARLRGLSPLFANGQIRLPRQGGLWLEHLIQELTHFPQGHLDLMDGLWLAIQGIEAQRVVPRIRHVGDCVEDDVYFAKPSGRNCHHCGKTNKPDAIQCSGCGKRFREDYIDSGFEKHDGELADHLRQILRNGE